MDKEYNFSEKVTAVSNELLHVEPERKIRVNITPDVIVHGDPVLLRILLDNLLRNAWKFTAKHDDALIEFGT